MMPAKMQFLFGWVLLALLSLNPVGAHAENSVAAFEAANKLYEQGDYSAAAAAYEKLIEGQARSAAVYFNLGNAFFKAGQVGRAIVAYRVAEKMTPRDPDVRANLRFARQQSRGPSELPGRWVRWLGTLTLNEWTALAAVGLWVFLLLLALLQWRPSWKPVLRGYLLASGAATLLLAICLGTALYQQRTVQLAIVIARDAPVRNGPLDVSQTVFVAHDGAELRVVDQQNEWVQVSAGTRLGWVRRDSVALAPAS